MNKSTNDKIGVKQQILDILREPTKGEWSRMTIAEKTRLEKTERLIQLIKETLQECIGEKIKLPTATYQNIGDGYTDSRIGYKNGWNDLRQDALNKLDSLLDPQED